MKKEPRLSGCTLPPVVHRSELDKVLRRYRNAKRRALYWSGNPSFAKRSVETRSSRLSEKYELAMCDCKNWEHDIERLTGHRPPHYDPKASFDRAWSRLSVNPAVRGREPASVPCTGVVGGQIHEG